MIVPIIIYVREKSEKELREEMKMDARMRKAIEEDERRERERKRRKEEEKRRKAEEEYKRLEKEYMEARAKDPWQFHFLPEGWSIFGQTNFGIIDLY